MIVEASVQQVEVERSKAIDNSTDFNSTFPAFVPTNLKLERALSVFDIRHKFCRERRLEQPV